MKTEDSSKKPNVKDQPTEKLICRREALNKAGVYALSAATMMVLMKSQAKAQMVSPTTVPIRNTPSTTQTGTWKRTERS